MPRRSVPSHKPSKSTLPAGRKADRGSFADFWLGFVDTVRTLEDPVQLMEAVLHLLGDHLQVDRALYAEVVENGSKALVTVDYRRSDVPPVAGLHNLANFGPWVARALQTGRTLVLQDYRHIARLAAAEKAAFEAVGVSAHMTVPLIRNDELIALLSVVQGQPRRWTAGEVKLVKQVAERTWDAVEMARSEAALRRSEERYRSLFEAIGQGFSVIEMLYDTRQQPIDFRFQVVNPAFRQHTGYAVNPGQRMREIAPEIDAEWLDIFSRVARDGEPVRFQKTSRISGKTFDVYAYRCDFAEQRRVAVLFDNISSRLQADEERRRQTAIVEGINRILQMTLETASSEELGATCLQAAAALTSSRYGFIFLKQNRHLRFLADDHPALTRCLLQLSGDDPAPSRQETDGTILQACIHRSEIWQYSATEGSLPGLGQAWPVAAPSDVLVVPLLQAGRAIGAIGLVRQEGRFADTDLDAASQLATVITEAHLHLATEQQRQESEARFRMMANGLPLMIWVHDDEGRLNFVNRTFRTFFGVEEGADALDDWEKRLHPEDRVAYLAEFLDCLRHLRDFHGEVRVLRFDGVWRRLESWARPRFSNGHFLGFVGTSVDITERQEMEDELRRSRRVAEEASRAKSDFLASMSHEIRTPMTIFLAALERLRKLNQQPEQQRLLEMADNAARRLRGQINHILDFSRIESRHIELKEEPFDLRACLLDAMNMFEMAAGEKGLHLRTDVAADLPSIVLGDQARLGQVLVNLIGNAVKFTERGKVRLRVERRNDQLQFTVSDTGVGIPAESHDALFHWFYQADNQDRQTESGSGLGLAICRGLVELMGGRIELAGSCPGTGTTITFFIPLRIPTGVSQACQAEPSAQAAGALAGLNILLAEDDAMIREIFAMTLQRLGGVLTFAENGREAVEKWRQESFDLLLMDLQMPELGGMEAARRIRDLERGGSARIPIVGLTAHARSSIRKECLQAGMDEILIKPFSTDDLENVVARVREQNRSTGESQVQ